jgi:SAM-dependent methyltransferase
MPKKTITTLHLGCGNNKVSDSIGIDFSKNTSADIIHDLNKFPYPFPSNRFEKIIMINIIEHLEDIVKVMEEINRISKNGAHIFIQTGHFSAVDSFTDPTHKHFFTSRSFDYFIPGKDLYKYQYSKARFKLSDVWVGPKKSENYILRIILQLINRHIIFYESRLAFLFPVGVIYYELKVCK